MSQRPPWGPPPFDATDAIGYGWRTFIQNLGPFLLVGLLAIAASFVFNMLGQLVAMIFTAALIRGAFDAAEGRTVGLGAMFSRWSFAQVVLLSVLVSVATTVGLALCVLPGIAVMFLTWFASYFVVGSGQDAITAIVSSFRLVAGNIRPLLLLALLSVVVIVVGVRLPGAAGAPARCVSDQPTTP